MGWSETLSLSAPSSLPRWSQTSSSTRSQPSSFPLSSSLSSSSLSRSSPQRGIKATVSRSARANVCLDQNHKVFFHRQYHDFEVGIVHHHRFHHHHRLLLHHDDQVFKQNLVVVAKSPQFGCGCQISPIWLWLPNLPKSWGNPSTMSDLAGFHLVRFPNSPNRGNLIRFHHPWWSLWERQTLIHWRQCQYGKPSPEKTEFYEKVS